jgi:hypothetical protein
LADKCGKMAQRWITAAAGGTKTASQSAQNQNLFENGQGAHSAWIA